MKNIRKQQYNVLVLLSFIGSIIVLSSLLLLSFFFFRFSFWNDMLFQQKKYFTLFNCKTNEIIKLLRFEELSPLTSSPR